MLLILIILQKELEREKSSENSNEDMFKDMILMETPKDRIIQCDPQREYIEIINKGPNKNA